MVEDLPDKPTFRAAMVVSDNQEASGIQVQSKTMDTRTIMASLLTLESKIATEESGSHKGTEVALKSHLHSIISVKAKTKADLICEKAQMAWISKTEGQSKRVRDFITKTRWKIIPTQWCSNIKTHNLTKVRLGCKVCDPIQTATMISETWII